MNTVTCKIPLKPDFRYKLGDIFKKENDQSFWILACIYDRFGLVKLSSGSYWASAKKIEELNFDKYIFIGRDVKITIEAKEFGE